ncbi:MAG: ComEC/Rec2 family competence protein [Candidatus Gracilibacteria bacterium]|nr:ComEC/Rec2 family competence protein [Candidatus Gracilibacteria bacterium]
MTFKNLQKRVGILVYYYLFLISLLGAVFITNLYKQLFLYIFLLIIIISVNYVFWYYKFWRLIIFILLGLLFGFFISINAQNKVTANYSLLNGKTDYLSKKVLITGEILENYKESDTSNSYIIRIQKINSETLKSKLNLLITTNTKIIFNKGDILEFSSKINKISNFNEFEYDKFLQLKDIYGQLYLYQFSKTGNSLNKFSKFIYDFKLNILKTINNIYPGNSAKLLSGIFLGVRGNYSTELKTGFNNSGLTHIVAVSGYNITILIIFIALIFKGLSGYIKHILVIFSVIFFILLIGDNTPALRAGIMGIIGYIVMLNGRKLNIYTLLIAIASVFVVLNPLIINYDISFHLTFLALLGLIIFQEKLSRLFYFLPKKFQIKESIATTLSVFIFTLPIMLVNFEKISVIAPISNLLVLPLIPISMLFGFISIITYLIYTKLGIFIGYLTYLFLSFILNIASYLGNSQFSIINYDLGIYKSLFIFFYYFILVFIIFYTKPSEKDLKQKI